MIYADSSVIVKRYYQEAGTLRVKERWADAQRIFTSRVAYAEVHPALARKRRDRGLTASQLRIAESAFEKEWTAYDQIQIDSTTMGEVRRLVRRYALCGFDAIHLSAPLWLLEELGAPLEFGVADEKLEAAARSEHLVVVNPESHP